MIRKSIRVIGLIVYNLVATLRVLQRVLLTTLSTTYYRITCMEFGANSVVRWGTWIRYPKNVSIGDNVFIGNNVLIGSETKESKLKIASRVQINDSVCLDYTGGVSIGESTLIAEETVIYSHSHGLNPRSRPVPMKKIIRDNCWIGSRATVLESCGEIISGTVVGSGAVVTKDLSERGVYVGVPARLVRSLPNNDMCSTSEQYEKTHFVPGAAL